MQSVTKPKYLLKLIFNHNEIRHLIKMKMSYSSAKSPLNGKSTKYRQHKKVFIDNTGLNTHEIESMLCEHIKISKLPINQIVNSLKLCKKFNIDMCSVKYSIEFLYLNSEELRHRLMILTEMGAKYITTKMIYSLANITSVDLFKAFSRIPEDAYVSEIMYSHLHEPPPAIHLSETLNERMTVYTYRQKCVIHYLQWRFRDFKHDTKMLIRLTRKLMYKPLSEIEHSFDVLYNHAKMPIEVIWKYQCLAECSPNELKRILKEIPTICGVSIEELLNTSPALHSIKYKNVLRVKQEFEAHHITCEQLKNCPNVLLREANDFMKDWTTLTQEPQLRIQLQHPKILRILTLREGLHDRLRYLHYVNLHSVTVDILISSSCNFERMVRVGAFRNRLKEISMTLSCYLKIDTTRIEETLIQHPHWRHVNLLNIINTLFYLKTKFNDADIASNLYAIFYSKDDIHNILENLFQQNEMMEASNRFTSSQLLALSIYEIEKNFHFTGDGIWENND